MKALNFILLAVLLVSCSKEEIEVTENFGLYEMKFTSQDYQYSRPFGDGEVVVYQQLIKKGVLITEFYKGYDLSSETIDIDYCNIEPMYAENYQYIIGFTLYIMMYDNRPYALGLYDSVYLTYDMGQYEILRRK